MYLLSGSLAYDTILLHEGKFHTRILPEEISRLNVSFGIDSVEEEFGGTGGNIAYNSSLLEQFPVICTTVGKDFYRYNNHLKERGIDTSSISKVENKNTAHAWLLTDEENNQITGFSSGAMKFKPKLPTLTPKLWHLAPESVGNTAWLAKKAVEEKKNYFFDPGQAIGAFIDGVSENIYPFTEIIKNSTGIFVNEYETQLLENYLKKPVSQFLNEKTNFIVQTLGSKGLILHTLEGSISIPVAKPSKIVDPTGCGDALRAGFIYGYTNGLNLKESAQLGSIMGSFAIEESGGQNHKPSKLEIFKRLKENYNLIPNKAKSLK